MMLATVRRASVRAASACTAPRAVGALACRALAAAAPASGWRGLATETLKPTTGPTKATTGLVGLAVVPNAREVLVELYEKTLKDIQIIPEHVPYRKAVEAFTQYRMDVVRRLTSVEAIEAEIGVGQVEELIEQAKDELRLIPEYASWKEWEQPYLHPVDDEQELEDELDGLDELKTGA